MSKILAIGNALVDILIKLQNDQLLKEFNLAKGSMQLCDMALVQDILLKTVQFEKVQASGGSAANTIHGLAKLGAQTGYIGKVGKDDFADFFRNDMSSNTISANLSISNTPTGRAVALVSPDSERTFATYLGAAVELSPADITAQSFAGYDYLHIEGYLVFNHDLMVETLRLAKAKNLTVSLDLASFNVVEANREFLYDIIKEYVDIVFANEEEAKSFTGSEPQVAVNEIAKITDIAVVKLGKDGSLIQQKNNVIKVPGIKANAIDTTGAGDLFAAGFLFGLLTGKSFETCGRYGSLLGANVVEVIGAKMDDVRWKKILTSL